MSREAARLSILVLSEDSAKDACETITTLAKKMLLLVDQLCGTHLIRFEPQGELERQGMRGNLWKSAKPSDRSKIITLGRIIAAKLLEREPPGFVLFHFDGDRPWGEREQSENVAKFTGFVRTVVKEALFNALHEQQRALAAEIAPAEERTTRRFGRRWNRGQAQEGTPSEELNPRIAAALTHLLRLTPFYSVEAWVYQNTAEAARRCAAACGKHVEKIQGWETHRGALDDLPKPKDALCFGAEHNAALAGAGFPSDEVFRADKSYAAAVLGLLDCADLCDALTRTHA